MGINTHREANLQEIGENRTGNYIKLKIKKNIVHTEKFN